MAADDSLAIFCRAAARSRAVSSLSTTVNISPASGTPSNPPTCDRDSKKRYKGKEGYKGRRKGAREVGCEPLGAHDNSDKKKTCD